MALVLFIALLAALIVFDVYVMTIGIEHRDWQSETPPEHLHSHR